MENYQLLFESVFKKDHTSGDTVGFLEKITSEYPYFSTAQFYLLQSLKKDSPEYAKQVKQTAVIFNNNYWLNFQLLEAGRSHTLTVDQQKFSIEEGNAVADDDTTITEGNYHNPVIGQPFAEPAVDSTQAMETITINDASVTEAAPEQTGPVTLISQEEETKDKIDIDTAAPAVYQPGSDQLIIPNETKEDVAVEGGDAETTASGSAIKAEKEETGIAPPADNNPSDIAEEKEIPSIKLSLEQPPANVPDDAILFEPLHTTDYFASVGIKLSEEVKSADKLGKQLKSFTEWLKTMKKVHTEQLTRPSSPDEVEADNTESNIQQLAEKSNIDDEIVTEAMAAVLLQQGRTNKAVEVLEKLSLLNPGKSAYFAAKINQIKEA